MRRVKPRRGHSDRRDSNEVGGFDRPFALRSAPMGLDAPGLVTTKSRPSPSAEFWLTPFKEGGDAFQVVLCFACDRELVDVHVACEIV